MSFFKKIIDLVIERDEAKFQIQNASFDFCLRMRTKMIDGLIKRLLIYQFMHSKDPNYTIAVEEFRQNFLPEKQILDEDDILIMVEIIFKSLPEMQRLRLPEATIASISELYHDILRNSGLKDKALIFAELERIRNVNYLRNFGEQELNLMNYIIHVLKNEDENGVIDRMDIILLKKQIQIADNFGTDHEERAKVTMGA